MARSESSREHTPALLEAALLQCRRKAPWCLPVHRVLETPLLCWGLGVSGLAGVKHCHACLLNGDTRSLKRATLLQCRREAGREASFRRTKPLLGKTAVLNRKAPYVSELRLETFQLETLLG